MMKNKYAFSLYRDYLVKDDPNGSYSVWEEEWDEEGKRVKQLMFRRSTYREALRAIDMYIDKER